MMNTMENTKPDSEKSKGIIFMKGKSRKEIILLIPKIGRDDRIIKNPTIMGRSIFWLTKKNIMIIRSIDTKNVRLNLLFHSCLASSEIR